MYFRNLNEAVRAGMLEEIRYDISRAALYGGERLSVRGRADWPSLLINAAENGTQATLAAELRRSGRLITSEMSHRGGRSYRKAVPYNAANTLAEGEFNRFYIRSVCRIALTCGQTHVTIYRAKDVRTPRPQSVSRVGSNIDARALLDDLRMNLGLETALGIPPGPNSGLSVYLLPISQAS
jgi:hypothetical protein